MATFVASAARGRISHLLLQEADVVDSDGRAAPGRIWAQSVNGVLELDGADAARFRKVAEDYGYAEMKVETKKSEAKPEPSDG